MATTVRKSFPPIPYGMADFRAIRREGYLYVDKTRFVRELENKRYAFFLRPRRFGKTCWLSVLEHYYDRTRKGGFEVLFADTDIGRKPTDNRSSYAVLRLDFSAFSKRLETLEERFDEYCHRQRRAPSSRSSHMPSTSLRPAQGHSRRACFSARASWARPEKRTGFAPKRRARLPSRALSPSTECPSTAQALSPRSATASSRP